MPLPTTSMRPATAGLVAALAFAGTAAAQQFVQETASRLPTQAEYSNQLSFGDIDGDGDIDVFVANGGNFSSPGPLLNLRVYVNDGTGVFADESDDRVGVTGLFRGVEMGDIDGDGDLDVIAMQDFNRRPILLINDGTGHYSSEGFQRGLTMTLSSSRAQFGDVDNDGDLDLFATTGTTSRFTCGQYRLYLNDGAGFFTDATATNVPTQNTCNNMDCIFGDIDNDFDIDIRTASTGTNNSRLYVNDGTGVFSISTDIPGDSTCYSYDFGDMDGDGDLDLLGANAGAGSTELLLRNNGDGSYINASSNLASNPNIDDNDSKFLDWDNDGDMDFIVGALGGGQERTYLNNGTGSFTLVTNVMPNQGDSTLDIGVADIDNDGDYDVMTAQGESGNFQNRIYVNTGPADTIPPTIVATEQVALPLTGPAAPVAVRALILDAHSSDRNFFDKGVHLNVSVDGGPIIQHAMKHSGGQVYRGEIELPPCGGTVTYYVTAIDWNDNIGSGDALMFDAPGAGGGPDTNGDLVVDVSDLVNVVLDWGTDGSANNGDVTCDGIVDVSDLVEVVLGWS